MQKDDSWQGVRQEPKDKRVMVLFEESLYLQVQESCIRNGCSMGHFIRQAARDAINEHKTRSRDGG